MSEVKCHYCDTELEKDIMALNLKLLGRQVEKKLCLTCLADYLGCEPDDLYIKIEEFKEQGCTLFE